MEWPSVLSPAIERDVDALHKPVYPGNYENITLQPRSSITLHAGVYFMNSFYGDKDAIINMQSDGEPVILYVKDSVTTRAVINHSRSSADFLIVFLGEGQVELDGPFSGAVIASQATIYLAPLNGGFHEGSFFGKRVNAEANTPIKFRPFEHWDWLMPPTISVDCVSRAARKHRAALFSFENPLEFEVTIPPGARNYIETEKQRQGPLEVFAPGVHSKYYWLPFVGDTLCWTLSGETVCADNSVRGCTLDDYTFIENDSDDSWLSMTHAPVPIACNIDQSPVKWKQWRNTNCMGSADTDSDTTGYTDDLAVMGTEIDWMKFFWEVNTSGATNQQLTISELLELMGLAGPGQALVEYEDFKDAVDSQVGSTTQLKLDAAQLRYFEEKAESAGIDKGL